MESDSRNECRTSAHDGHARLRSRWLLALGLTLLALGAGTLALTTPGQMEKPVAHAARFP